MLAKLDEGYDVVSGWRQDRKDGLFLRRIPSGIANGLISWVTGVHLNDYGCTLKACRREVLDQIRLYGELHRFIPAIASWSGASVAEMPMRHHAWSFGKSKYGISRTIRVLLDLATVKFLEASRPSRSTFLALPGSCSGASPLFAAPTCSGRNSLTVSMPTTSRCCCWRSSWPLSGCSSSCWGFWPSSRTYHESQAGMTTSPPGPRATPTPRQLGR